MCSEKIHLEKFFVHVRYARWAHERAAQELCRHDATISVPFPSNTLTRKTNENVYVSIIPVSASRKGQIFSWIHFISLDVGAPYRVPLDAL